MAVASCFWIGSTTNSIFVVEFLARHSLMCRPSTDLRLDGIVVHPFLREEYHMDI